MSLEFSFWQRFPSVNPSSDQSIGAPLAALSGGTAPSSAAWPVANDAMFVPVAIYRKLPVSTLILINGGTVAGNIDLGLYSEAGTKIVTTGALLQAGTNQPQQSVLAPEIFIGPGRYYLAVALSNITGTVSRLNLSIVRNGELGVAKMASAFPLPDTIVFASVTSGILPMVGFGSEGIY